MKRSKDGKFFAKYRMNPKAGYAANDSEEGNGIPYLSSSSLSDKAMSDGLESSTSIKPTVSIPALSYIANGPLNSHSPTSPMTLSRSATLFSSFFPASN